MSRSADVRDEAAERQALSMSLNIRSAPKHDSLTRRKKAQMHAQMRILYTGCAAITHAPAYGQDEERSVDLHVTQQLAQGGAVPILRQRIREGDSFVLDSRRRGNEPLGLTITLDR